MSENKTCWQFKPASTFEISVRFDLRLEKEPYTSYRLYAQAERDWD